MPEEKKKAMFRFLAHLRIYIFRGLLAIIPLFLSYLAIKLLYVLIDKRVMVFLNQFWDIRQIPGLGILLVLICLYLLGLIVSNFLGRQIFYFIEGVAQRTPLIKAVYHLGKQLSETLAGNGDKAAFQKVVLVDCNNSGVWTVAFLVGEVKDNRTGELLLKLFVPTVPNPTTGFIFIARQSQTVDPGWTVEEGIKMIISAAIISPKEINETSPNERAKRAQ
jgi:uncharacterized membrane protein